MAVNLSQALRVYSIQKTLALKKMCNGEKFKRPMTHGDQSIEVAATPLFHTFERFKLLGHSFFFSIPFLTYLYTPTHQIA